MNLERGIDKKIAKFFFVGTSAAIVAAVSFATFCAMKLLSLCPELSRCLPSS